MITALEALRLPSARLKDSDEAGVNRFLAQLDATVSDTMRRRGCSMPFNPGDLNPEIMHEIGVRLRRAGWAHEWREKREHSALTGRQEVVGYEIAVAPLAEAYDEADGATGGIAS